MRRRVLWAIVAVTAFGLVLFGIPLAAAVRSHFRSEEFTRLEREAARASARVPLSFNPRDPVDLPAAHSGLSVAVYDPSGRRVAGRGPRHGGTLVRRANRGDLAEGTDHGQLVTAVPVAGNERIVAVVRAASASSAVERRTRIAWLALAALGGLALAAAASVAHWRARALAKPVGELARTAAIIGRGDFTVRAPTSGVPELDAVAEALNATAARLDTLVSRERSFSAHASHQLRTPLTGLRLQLERAVTGDTGARDAISAALPLVDRLEGTIDELLALARDEHADRGPLDIHALFEELRATWHGTLAEHGRRLEIRLPDPLPTAHASVAAVRQVLEVLVDNAVRHGAGTVLVEARSMGQGVAIEVSDEGSGITANSDQIFRRRPSDSRRGIGLPLARALAEAEGGRLLLRHPGPGPVFAIVFPATARTTTP